jgi:hypothetical protein
MTASPNPAVYSQPVTYTATVSSAATPGTNISSGDVTFIVDGQSQAPVPLNASGQASITLSSLGVGLHSISASYGGSGNFNAGQTAAPLTQTVNQDQTTTTLGSSANPSVYGQAVIYTAMVSAVLAGSGIPTGYVNFVVDGKAPTAVQLNSLGQASFSLGSLGAGTHSINASYMGSMNALQSQANATQTVQLALSPALPVDAAGQKYSAQISASGGSGNYSYALASGSLPTGLSLSSSGLLSGTATVAGSYRFAVNATDNSLAGATGLHGYALTVNPGALTVVVGLPSAATAGTGFNAAITIKDAYGNGYTGPVSLSTSDGQAVSPATFTMTNGSTTVALSLRTAGDVTLTATAGSLKGYSVITINPAAAIALAVNAPGSATAGSSFNITVRAEDLYGNTATSFNGSVSLFTTDGQSFSPSVLTLSNGTATTALTLDRADTLKLAAGNGVIGGYSGLITVSPAAMPVVISTPSTVTAGIAFATTVTIKDAYGNGYTGPVSLRASDGQSLNVPSFTMSGGRAVLELVLDKADTISLTASAGSLTGSSGAITVKPGAAVALAVSAPSTATAGSSFNVTVTAQDSFGNTVTTSNGPVQFFSTDGQSVLPGSITLSNGTAMVAVTLDRANTLRLVAGNGVIAGSTGLITVSPATMRVVVSAPSAVMAGGAFPVNLTIKDAFGNGYNGPVTLASSDGQTLSLPSFNMVNGSATLSLVLKKAGTLTLAASAGSLKGSTNAITVNPAAAVTFAISAPGTVTAGTNFNVSVMAQDAYGNTVTTFNGIVNLYSTDGQSVSPRTIALSNGIATASVALEKANTLRLVAGNGVISGFSGPITVNPAAMSVVVIAPSSVNAGVGFAVTITIRDAYGNGYTGPMTLTSSDGEVLNVPSFQMVSGSASLLLVLHKAGTVSLTANAGSLKGISGHINVF